MTARENAEAAAEIFMRKRLILCSDSEPISGILTRDTIKLPGVAQVKNVKPKALKLDNVTFNCLKNGLTHRPKEAGLFSVVTVIDAVSAAILPVWVDFTSLKGLPCAPGPATTRRGMLVTNG